ncbi:MAG: hypothetical protein LQ344_003960 [Seirophora lacunosa]|nr:MAG: hypothetical protein LQ344_003960 [Seirophora lacunosa]
MPPLTLLRPLLFLSILLPPTTHAIGRSRHPESPDRGINCLGSSQCSFTTNNSPNILFEFNRTVSLPSPNNFLLPGPPLPPRALYFRNEHIACAENALLGSICLFLQGSGVPDTGVPGFVVRRRVQDLLDHGCRFCGSVPVSGDNRPLAAGVLTSNYVLGKGCKGVCELGRDVVLWEGMGNWTFVDGDSREPREGRIEYTGD